MRLVHVSQIEEFEKHNKNFIPVQKHGDKVLYVYKGVICGHVMKSGVCLLTPGHKGKHRNSGVKFCSSCGKGRMMTEPKCFVCQRKERKWS
jgi:hypothetical protein